MRRKSPCAAAMAHHDDGCAVAVPHGSHRGRPRRVFAAMRSRAVTSLARALLMMMGTALAGCSTLQHVADQPGLALTEASWQALHVADFAQTVTVARQPDRYREEGFPTELLIGEHPSESAVEGAWAGFALLHLAVTGYLAARVDRGRAWRWALYGWEALTIGDAAVSVAQNASLGLQPFGGHRP